MTDSIETAPGGQHHKVNSPHAVDARAQGASIVQVETVGRGLLIIVVVMLGLSTLASTAALLISSYSHGTAIRAEQLADRAEREGRLAQYELTLIRPVLRELGVATEDPETHEEE